jgi:hypothetical protein
MMSEVRTVTPKQARAVINLNPADITSVMLQEDVLSSLTVDELGKIAFAVNTEMQSRKR